MEQRTPEKEPESSFRGLYSKVKISVKTLDKIIIGGIIVGILTWLCVTAKETTEKASFLRR